MEFCEHGSLTSQIKHSIDPTLRDDWIKQLVLGLKHTHSLGVIHRDIKGDNIFLMLTGQIKIGDWGVAYKAADILLEKGQVIAGSGSGTWVYMAPEVTMIRLRWDGYPEFYDVKADIWSLGVVIYRLLAGGKTPFWKNSLKKRWIKGELKLPPLPEDVRQALQDMTI